MTTKRNEIRTVSNETLSMTRVLYAQTYNVNGIVISSAPAVLRQIVLSNIGGSFACFKIYDMASTPTGADTPIATFCIYSTETKVIPMNVRCSTGIALRCTNTIDDSLQGASGTASAHIFYDVL